MRRLIVIAAAGLMTYTIAGMAMLIYPGHVAYRPIIIAGIVGGPMCDAWIFPCLYKWWWK